MLSLYPKYRFDSIMQITEDDLKQMGVLGVAVDLDNTTAFDHTDIPLDGAVEWIAQMKRAGFKVLLLSNADKKRAQRLAKVLGDIDFVGLACKPLLSAYIRASSALRLRHHQIAMIGDQVFTDVYGANLAGMVSIYVKPFAMEERSVRSFKFRRGLEKKLFDRMDTKAAKKQK